MQRCERRYDGQVRCGSMARAASWGCRAFAVFVNAQTQPLRCAQPSHWRPKTRVFDDSGDCQCIEY